MNRRIFLLTGLLLAGCDGPAAQSAAPVIIQPVPLSQASALPDPEPIAGEAGVDVEIRGERTFQQSLPMVRGGLWQTLRTTKVSLDEKSQLYSAVHSADVRKLAGQTVTLRGYMLPLEAAERTGHFLISPYTPMCFFHPPAEPNEVVEVQVERPVETGFHLVEVTGILGLADDAERGLFFTVKKGRARVLERVE